MEAMVQDFWSHVIKPMLILTCFLGQFTLESWYLYSVEKPKFHERPQVGASLWVTTQQPKSTCRHVKTPLADFSHQPWRHPYYWILHKHMLKTSCNKYNTCTILCLNFKPIQPKNIRLFKAGSFVKFVIQS